MNTFRPVVGQTYKNGKDVRVVTEFDGFRVYYKSPKGTTEKSITLVGWAHFIQSSQKNAGIHGNFVGRVKPAYRPTIKSLIRSTEASHEVDHPF